jgi:hypothetical protein
VKKNRSGTDTALTSITQSEKQMKKASTQKAQVGLKRKADQETNGKLNLKYPGILVIAYFLTNINIELREYFVRLKNPNSRKVAFSLLKLRNKRTGEVQNFSCFKERALPEYMDNAIVTNFDMKKLEIEYDYDTDVD